MKVTSPKIPISVGEQHDTIVVSEHTLEAVRLVTPTATGSLTAVNIDECRLEKPFFAQARFDKTTFRDVCVLGGELSATRMQESGLQRVLFKDCRMTGFDISRSTLKDVQFVGCKLTMANMRFAKLTNVVFDDCILTDADLQGAQCKHVTFKNCTLERTSIHGIQAQAVDVRTSQLFDIRGWQDAKGITIDSSQLVSIAPELALALHITVSDD